MKSLAATIGVALLAACASYSSSLPTQPAFTAPAGLHDFVSNSIGSDVSAPPKCKGQTQTKSYATVAKQSIEEVKGSSLCVAAFGGWGGSLQFPGTYNASYTVSMTSSTTAYKGGLFPPGGSHTPIFYVQFAFSGFPGFYKKLPKGNPLESTHLAAGKPYTIEILEYFYGLGWSEVGECSQKAKKAKNGNGLAGAGTIFEGVTFREQKGVLEVFKGALVSNRC